MDFLSKKIVGLKNISLSIHSLSIPDRNSFARKKKRRKNQKIGGKRVTAKDQRDESQMVERIILGFFKKISNLVIKNVITIIINFFSILFKM